RSVANTPLSPGADDEGAGPAAAASPSTRSLARSYSASDSAPRSRKACSRSSSSVRLMAHLADLSVGHASAGRAAAADLQRADQLAHGAQTVLLQISCDAAIDRMADQRFIEQRRADPDGRGAGDEKLQRIGCADDTALADDRNAARPGDFVDLFHLQQRDRLDGGARQTALHVGEHGGTAVNVDRHAGHGVDDRQRIAAGFDAHAGALANVGLIGRELGDEGLLRCPPAGCYDACRHLRDIAELDAALLDVGTRDIDLDGIDGRLIEPPRDLDVLLDGRATHIGDEARLLEVQCRQDALDDLCDAWILQPDRVENALRRLIDAVRRVTQAR